MTMQTKIDFFVPGFSKCGTTTLFRVLTHHPEIFIPEIKEPMYFGSSAGEDKTAWFEALYSHAKNGQLKGDCSTFYSSIYMEADAGREMFQNNPRAKLIFIARDPIDRIESSFREMHNSAPKFGLNTPFDLEEALLEMPQLIEDTAFFSRINIYRNLFGDKNVLVIFMEDLKADTQAVSRRCYDFLGLGEHRFTRQMLPHMNKGKDKLYDSNLFRKMRTHPVVGPWLSKVSIPKQDKIAVRLGLRKPFAKQVQWSDQAKALVKKRLAPDIDAFLLEYGELKDRWPRYQALLRQCRP